MAKKATTAKKEKKSSGKKADAILLGRPRITEKTAHASAESVYVFDVATSATKSEIAKAFEVIYKHVPLKVRTLNQKPKAYFRRTAQGSTLGFGKRVKKAYVYLPKGTSIEVM
jgi:large subunit ribosomal protein L23